MAVAKLPSRRRVPGRSRGHSGTLRRRAAWVFAAICCNSKAQKPQTKGALIESVLSAVLESHLFSTSQAPAESVALAWLHPMAACSRNDLVTGAPPADCVVVTEWQFVTDVLLGGQPLSDATTHAGTVVVAVAHVGERTPAEERRKLAAMGKVLDSLDVPACLLHLSDEVGTVDDFYEPWPFIMRQYWSPQLRERWGDQKLAFMPLGFATGHNRYNDASVILSQRPLNWTFVGYPGHPTRRAMLNAMQSRVPGGMVHETSSVAVGFQWSPDLLPAPEIAGFMRNSKFCPAPMGFVAPDSFRLWEALEASCIPLLDAVDIQRHDDVLHDRSYFPAFFEYLTTTYIHPFTTYSPIEEDANLFDTLLVHDWAQGASQIAQVLHPTQADHLDIFQARLANWWHSLKQGIAAYVRLRLEGLRRCRIVRNASEHGV